MVHGSTEVHVEMKFPVKLLNIPQNTLVHVRDDIVLGVEGVVDEDTRLLARLNVSCGVCPRIADHSQHEVTLPTYHEISDSQRRGTKNHTATVPVLLRYQPTREHRKSHVSHQRWHKGEKESALQKASASNVQFIEV